MIQMLSASRIEAIHRRFNAKVNTTWSDYCTEIAGVPTLLRQNGAYLGLAYLMERANFSSSYSEIENSDHSMSEEGGPRNRSTSQTAAQEILKDLFVLVEEPPAPYERIGGQELAAWITSIRADGRDVYEQMELRTRLYEFSDLLKQCANERRVTDLFTPVVQE